MGLVVYIRKRVRAYLLLPDSTESPTTASAFVDQIRMLVLTFGLGLLVTAFLSGTSFLRGLSVTLLGFRPIGALDTTLTNLFVFVAAPLCFLAWTVWMVLTLWRYRSNSLGLHLLIAVLISGGPFFYLFWFGIAPRLNSLQHLNNWPALLELANFEVCAIDVRELRSRTTAPEGRIAIDLVNRSDSTLQEATFSVRAGSEWLKLSVSNLPPHERRRVEREADLGDIEVELSGDHTGWAERPGEIYWDSVRFTDGREPRRVPRPEIADVQPIPDCPRFDISGIWQGAGGTEMQLSQRGTHPQGFVRGVTSSRGVLVDGTFDGKTFSGTLDGHGRFELQWTEGRLQGHWSLLDGQGLWNLTRTGPAPPAPRRR